MKRLAASFTLIALLVIPLHAVSYIAFEQITVAATAIGFTATSITPQGPPATTAVCRLETAQLRYTVNGTTPTTTVGTLWEVGEMVQFNGHDILVNFRAIRTGGTSGQLDCTYSAP